MDAPLVHVVRTGTANLASVLAGLRRAGAQAVVVEDRRALEAAAIVVLPGVGAFGAVMARLGELDLIDMLRERFTAGRPTLGVCLGLQVLAERSEESPGVRGLGVVAGAVRRFPDTVRAPQLGWNRVVPQPGCALLEEGYVYFANSYRLVDVPAGWSAALADHGGPFVAAMEKGALLACQFHPELSGDCGLALLKRWLARAAVEGGAAC
ncbi:MAG: imidazole glycerol phosphate synthase subunit HisH [Myxococcales bacterium]|nr:MAG: imidazole glycerol phosphate synthase subunit HisH [Myxococcales bacterium]